MSISELLSIAAPIAGLVAALIGVIWSMLNRRIDALEKTMNVSFTGIADRIGKERTETTRILEKDRDKFTDLHNRLSEKVDSKFELLLVKLTELAAKAERD